MATDADFRADFSAVAQAALAQAESLVPAWLPGGRREGHEWKCGGVDGAPGRSLSINLRTGIWKDFADDEYAGADLVALYAAVYSLKPWEACRELAGQLGVQLRSPTAKSGGSAPPPPPPPPAPTPAPAAEPSSDASQWLPLHPVPADAPPYQSQWAHYARGVPGRHWEYRNQAGELLGVVCRFDTSDGGKEIQPLSYCQHVSGSRRWRYKAFADPRPMYGLERIPATGAELGIMVEGEKCADALWEALGRTIPVLSWPGGGKAVRKVDLEPLRAFQRLVGWPDADAQVDKRTHTIKPLEDQPGMQAMRYIERTVRGLGVAMRLVDIGQPGDRAPGWDCADAIADGWDKPRLIGFMRQLLPEAAAPAADSSNVVQGDFGGKGPPRRPAPAGSGGSPPEGEEEWRRRLIWQHAWTLRECTPNVITILLNHDAWRGVVGFDEFAQRTVKVKRTPYDPPGALYPAEWSDQDDTRTVQWLAERERFVPSSSSVAEAVEVVARANTFHPVLNYLRSLKHDGIDRVDTWLTDFLGVPDTPYARLVGRFYLVAMCMRVMQPGVKFDYCLVLEGTQGRRKSTALEALAGEWFSETDLDLTHKDSMSYIRGKWLHEFSELGSLMRAEERRQKSFLSRRVDEFRPTYGRREIRCLRQIVFAGTTNEYQWNKDPTGGRRFWPISIPGDIDLTGLRAMRDQLFAEAFQLAQQGERFWPTAEEQREHFDEQQIKREMPEAFVSLLHTWINEPDAPEEFPLARAITDGLKIEPRAITRDIQTRAGIALTKLQCERVEKRNHPDRTWYKRPRRNAASSTGREDAQHTGTDGAGWEDPFK